MATGTRVGIAGSVVMGVAFGMVRYAYGLALPELRAALDVPEPVLGLMASGTFAGFLLALALSGPLARRMGPRAPTTTGAVSGCVGCALIAAAPGPAVLALGALVAGSAAGWVWAPYSTATRPRLLADLRTDVRS